MLFQPIAIYRIDRGFYTIISLVWVSLQDGKAMVAHVYTLTNSSL